MGSPEPFENDKKLKAGTGTWQGSGKTFRFPLEKMDAGNSYYSSVKCDGKTISTCRRENAL